jgi:hypothetical protein
MAKIKVMVFSRHDWANSAWKMTQAMNRHSEKYELHYFAFKPHPYGYYRGENVICDNDGYVNNKAVRVLAELNKSCDLIHFKGDEGIIKEVADVKLNINKPIVWTVCGIQWRGHHAEIWEYNKPFIKKIVATTPDLIYDTPAEILPFAVDENKYKPIDKSSDCIVIGHSVSTDRKGSNDIMRIVDELTHERNNVFMNFQEGLPHTFTMELKRLNHIFVDQCFEYGIYGNSGVEGMAFKSAVVVQTNGKQLCGVTDATVATLKQVMIELIDNPELLKQRQEESYARFLRLHSYKAVATRLERIYDEVLAQ